MKIIAGIQDRQLTANLRLHEFIFTESMIENLAIAEPMIRAEYSREVEARIIRVAECVQIIRDKFGEPAVVTSGFRPVAWEKFRGRSGTSQHPLGWGADFYIRNVPLNLVYMFLDDTFSRGGRAISQKGRFVHLDRRLERAEWKYDSP